MNPANQHQAAASTAYTDLASLNLLEMVHGERLWKLYFFQAQTGPDVCLEHCLYTKRKKSGRLAMVSFARQLGGSGAPSRSGLAKVADLSDSDLSRIVSAIRGETEAGGTSCIEIDLSSFGDLQGQYARLIELAGRGKESG
jgi:hypothetical protein